MTPDCARTTDPDPTTIHTHSTTMTGTAAKILRIICLSWSRVPTTAPSPSFGRRVVLQNEYWDLGEGAQLRVPLGSERMAQSKETDPDRQLKSQLHNPRLDCKVRILGSFSPADFKWGSGDTRAGSAVQFERACQVPTRPRASDLASVNRLAGCCRQWRRGVARRSQGKVAGKPGKYCLRPSRIRRRQGWRIGVPVARKPGFLGAAPVL